MTEVMKREAQCEATGTPGAPTQKDYTTAYPGGSDSNTIMAAAIPTFQQARCPKLRKDRLVNPTSGKFALGFDSCITVAVPLLAV